MCSSTVVCSHSVMDYRDHGMRLNDLNSYLLRGGSLGEPLAGS